MQQSNTFDKNTENKIIAWANEQYRTMKNSRSRIELEWARNMAFYFGKQYVEPVRSGLTSGFNGVKLFVPPAPPWRTRLVVNRIKPVIRTEISKLTSQKPSVTVTPASSEDRDLFAAQAAEQIWEYLYRNRRVKSTIRKSAWWLSITGVGYIKTYWNPTEFDAASQSPGTICFSSVTPFNIMVPNLREEEIEDQPYVMEVQARSVDWVKANYPDIGSIETDSSAANDILSDAFIDILAGQDSNRKNSVMVKEIWFKPGQVPNIWPQGGMITIVGNKVVQAWQGWPYEHNLYPFAKLEHIPTGKYYPSSTICDLIPLQKELNRTRSQVVENKNKMSKPQLVAPKGSVDASRITSEPGLVIEYTPGFDPPTPLPLQGLPAYVTQEIDRILQDINDISGQHEVSKGQTPPGVTAATAISYLQEQDESMLSYTFDSLEECIEKSAFIALSLVHQFWTMPRQINIAGSDGMFDVMSFEGSKLNTSSDIRVEGGSSLPTSKSARTAFVMDLMKLGFIDPNEGLEVLDMGGINKLTDKIKLDTRQATRENLKMSAVTQQELDAYKQLQMNKAQMQLNPATGQPEPTNPQFIDQTTGMPINPPIIIPVNTWDNHIAHIRIHNNYRKGQGFEGLPDVNKELFEAHVQDHLNAFRMEQLSLMPKGNMQQSQSEQQPESTPPQDDQQNQQPDFSETQGGV